MYYVCSFRTRAETSVHIKDYREEEVVGSFYPEELQEVNTNQDHVCRIEEILMKKGWVRNKCFLIKWKRWPEIFNSWIKASQELQ